ncbi:RHS repeat-associated core domain-containing protein [Pseudomonas carassii]|uniref:RHS repeat-associated core domain-containing protein n=1 Tax=Pseudomonas carassii TaxID=3115855 RepID=A0ABU7HGM0_9PSED|nr:RHS repeat-associated core domain-containing protein [Pseudomonas sp. 137P]MEE1889786.1 RHS repeat-associated core domain-containing protein [Pseudomonas sp. 137P]
MLDIDAVQREPLLYATDDSRTPVFLHNRHQPEYVSFDAYGHLPPIRFLLVGFKGDKIEPSGSFYLLGNGRRAYNYILRRFHSPDSKSPFDEGGINAYCFVLGDPINGSDPSGNTPKFKNDSVNRYYGPFVGLSDDSFSFAFFTPSVDNPETLNFSFHAKPGYAVIGGKDYDAKGFVDFARNKNLPIDKFPINITGCHSADINPDTGQAFAQDIANLVGQHVTAYKGSPASRTKIKKAPKGSIYPHLKFEVLTKNPFKKSDGRHALFHYEPVSFPPLQEHTSRVRNP